MKQSTSFSWILLTVLFGEFDQNANLRIINNNSYFTIFLHFSYSWEVRKFFAFFCLHFLDRFEGKGESGRKKSFWCFCDQLISDLMGHLSFAISIFRWYAHKSQWFNTKNLKFAFKCFLSFYFSHSDCISFWTKHFTGTKQFRRFEEFSTCSQKNEIRFNFNNVRLNRIEYEHGCECECILVNVDRVQNTRKNKTNVKGNGSAGLI